METIIIILFIVGLVSFALQMQVANNKWLTTSCLIILAVAAYFAHYICIEQSYSSIKASLSNHELMMNFVVIQIIEALGGILISLYNVRKHYHEKVNPFFKYYNFVPGIIAFPALFYFETLTFLINPEIDFIVLAIAFALAVPAIIILLKMFFQVIIPDFEMLMETKFFIHIIQLIGGIWLSISFLKLPVAHSNSSQFDILPLIALAAILIIGGMGGGIWYHFKLKRIQKSI